MAITFYAPVLIRHSFPLWDINYQTGIRACSFNYARVSVILRFTTQQLYNYFNINNDLLLNYLVGVEII